MPTKLARLVARVCKLLARAGHDMKQYSRGKWVVKLRCRRCGDEAWVIWDSTLPRAFPKCQGRAGE